MCKSNVEAAFATLLILTCTSYCRAGAMADVLPYGPAIIEHCLSLAGLDPALRPKAQPLTAEQRSALLHAIRQLESWFGSLDSTVPEGLITTVAAGSGKKGKQQLGAAVSAGAGGGEAVPRFYQDFHPLVLHQIRDAPMNKFPTFDAALDEFFSKIEGQRIEASRMDVSPWPCGCCGRYR